MREGDQAGSLGNLWLPQLIVATQPVHSSSGLCQVKIAYSELLLKPKQIFYFLFIFFIVVQVQLSPFSLHHSPCPHPSPPPTFNLSVSQIQATGYQLSIYDLRLNSANGTNCSLKAKVFRNVPLSYSSLKMLLENLPKQKINQSPRFYQIFPSGGSVKQSDSPYGVK